MSIYNMFHCLLKIWKKYYYTHLNRANTSIPSRRDPMITQSSIRNTKKDGCSCLLYYNSWQWFCIQSMMSHKLKSSKKQRKLQNSQYSFANPCQTAACYRNTWRDFNAITTLGLRRWRRCRRLEIRILQPEREKKIEASISSVHILQN